MKPTAFLLTLALPLLAGAQTQPVWRCGSDARSYSATPCPEGRALDLAEARPASDVSAARQLAERERRLAGTLQKEREQREAKAVGTGLAGFPAPKVAVVKPLVDAPRRPKRRAKLPEADGTWKAIAPVSPRKQG